MNLISIFLAQLLDPIRLIIIYLIIFGWRKKHIVFIASAIAAVLIELFLYSTQITYCFTLVNFISGCCAGLIQAYLLRILYWQLIRKIASRFSSKK